MRIGTNELLVILLVALVIFGPQQLPKLGKMFGKTMKSFQEGIATSDTDKADAAAPADSSTVSADSAESAEAKKAV